MEEISTQGVAQLSLIQFGCVYLLLFLVLTIMWRAKSDKTKTLFLASMRMTVQMVIAGVVIQLIFGNPRPVFTVLYLAAMVGFAIHRVLSGRKDLNRRFQWIVALSLACSGLSVLAYFVGVIVRQDLFNPQYAIPLAGMIVGNSMNGVALGLKSFLEQVKSRRVQINALLNLGVEPSKILRLFINNALETALTPTINTMVGMGIVSLPGMMTGQILAGTLPTTAVLYQIAVIISNCTGVCLTVFLSLQLGHKTLYNSRNQMSLLLDEPQ